MKKILVVYQSKYGSTRQYAEWIADSLGADLKERREVKPDALREYECVVYGGGLYGPSGIIGADLVAKNPCNKLVVFTVGAADPEDTDYTEILEHSFPLNTQSPLKVFHLRGILDYKKLGFVHKGMMAMLKKMTLDKKKPEDYTGDDKLFSETYGKRADFMNRDAILPLTEYVRELVVNDKSNDGE